MKLKTILAATALAATAALTACSGAGTADGKSAMPANASTADSVMYYFGQMRAADYWRQTQNDTTLAEESARQAYLRGLRAGLDAVRGNEKAYDQGVLMGVQMAMNLAEFAQTYDITPNQAIMLQSLATALKNDSVLNNRDMQRDFYNLMQTLNNQRDQRMAEAAVKVLKKAATPDMQPVDSTLYGRTVKTSDGEQLRAGDRVKVQIAVTDQKGEPVKARMPQEITIGDRYVSAPISAAVASMRTGETRQFITTAFCLLGQRTRQLNLDPEQVLNIEITTGQVIKSETPAAGPQPAMMQPGAVHPRPAVVK